MSVVKRTPTEQNNNALIRREDDSAGSSGSIQLIGHEEAVLGVAFDATGQHLASCSSDSTVFLWNVYGGNENYGMIRGHKSAVLDVAWSRDSRNVFTGSADLTVGVWDVESGSRVRKHEGHEDMVNSIDVVRRGTEMIVSGSDDGSIGLWDPREKEAVKCLQTDFPIIAVAVDSVGERVYSGGVDSGIKVWDVRKTDEVLFELTGHEDCNLTGLAVSADDQNLVSQAMDNTVRTWDIRSFVAGGDDKRALKVFDGAPNGVQQDVLRTTWNNSGTRIAAGSADLTAVIWDVYTRKIVHKLPGHIGAVHDVAFSPIDETVFASASADKTVILSAV